MSLDGSLAIATSGLANINRQLAVVSQNVANAATPDYARQISTQTSVSAAGQGMGVQTGLVQRAIDQRLQADLFRQNGVVAGMQARQSALGAIDAVQGTPGQDNDLASLLGKVQDAFSTLANDPGNATQQAAVVGAAQSLTQQVNALSGAYTDGRNAAQAAIVADVGTLNGTLAQIGSLSDRVVQLRALGQNTADIENQRDAAVDKLSSVLDVRALAQPNGDMLVMTTSGLSLPTHSATPPFATSAATLGPGAYQPGGGVPAITLGGRDVTASLAGGTLGANITLRDTTLPTDQAELDEFAQTLSERFDQQGLKLFTDPTGAVPTRAGVPAQAGYIGYAASIGVNPAVAATPSLVRDGTQAVAGSPTGASAFTPNPAGGPAGFSGLIGRVLSYALGSQAQAGVAQPLPATSGLGPTRTLAAPYAPPATLEGLAGAVVAAQAQDSAAVTTALGDETAVQTALQGKFTAASGVSMDTEMSTMIQLQSSYAATAKLVSSVQTMWNQTLQMVQ